MHTGLTLIATWFAGLSLAEPRATDAEANAAATRIDAALELALTKQSDRTVNKGVPETPATVPASDAEFLRRATIDLAGRLPTAHEARDFAVNAGPGKHAAAVDRLVREPAAGDWRFQRMADALRVTDEVLGVPQTSYLKWLRGVFGEDRPVDRIVADLLEARGTLAENPAAGYLLRDFGQVQITAAELARAFLGEDIHCAICHDHPFTDHTQRGLYEFAACFNVVRARPQAGTNSAPQPKTLLPGARPLPRAAKTPAAELPAIPGRPTASYFNRLELAEAPLPLLFPADYKYRDGKPGDQVTPRYLPLERFRRDDPRSAFLARPAPSRVREQVVLWLLGRENGHFATVTAVRIWDWMFGVPARSTAERLEAGFSDPQPPHAIWQGKGCGQPMPFHYGDWMQMYPDFAAVLGREFVRCDCRIGEFQRVLARTHGYRQRALPPDGIGQTRLLPAPVVRRLPAEIIWDSLVGWLPRPERTGLWRSSVDMPQVPAADHPLRILGRGSRQWADESRAPISHHLARLLIAAPIVQSATRANSELVQTAMAESKRENQVETLFLAILGRLPDSAEERFAIRHFTGDPKTAAGDLAWALLNTSEFVFNH